MTNEQRAHKQAAKASKTGVTQFVVYVFDEGYSVYGSEQCSLWASLILVEACYTNGALIALPVSA